MKTFKSSTCNHARATHTYVGKIRDLLARRTTLLGSATTIVYVDERKKKIISIGIMIILMEVFASMLAAS